MHDSESGRSTATATPTIRPVVAEVIRAANDARLSADQVVAAARHAVAAWLSAVAGDDAALAAMASSDVARWLLHPLRENWQVAPGPVVTDIQIWRLEADANQPLMNVSIRFSGRQVFDDHVEGSGPGAPSTDDVIDFAGRFELALADAVGWRLVSGRVETLDDFYGYVFKSQHETADEYLARTGTIWTTERAGPSEAAGSPRTFRITAGFAEHDVRFGASASVQVQRPTAPSRDEAEQLVWPAVEEATVNALGEGDWQPSLNWIDVIELWPSEPLAD